jgi:general secretion pathway protein G
MRLTLKGKTRTRSGRVAAAFTLVEILIVVVILGILAAVVVPQFAEATSQAQEVSARDQLNKLRRALAMYYARGSRFPNVAAGDGTWGELLTQGYMREAPTNTWVGMGNSRVIVLRGTADTAWQSTHGWVFDAATGNVWAGGFSDVDEAWPQP